MVLVEMEDLAGNQAQVESVGVVVFDFTPPAVVQAQADPAAASGGDTVVVTVEVSEPLAEHPILTATKDLVVLAVEPLAAEGTTFTWSYTVQDADLAGVYELSLELADPAGNLTITNVGTFEIQ